MVHFDKSSIDIGHNVVKSVLFKLAGISVNFAVFKVFALFASIFNKFTAYLMFTENYIQRGIFIFTSKFSSSALFVLGMSVFMVFGALYDTLLWGLDAPGYLVKMNDVFASTIENDLLKTPEYVVGLPNPLDVTAVVGNNLFEPNINFTLTGKVKYGSPEPVSPTKELDTELGVGPRLWLEKDGFSVAPYNSNLSSALFIKHDAYNCPWTIASDKSVSWNCFLDNKFSKNLQTEEPVGYPMVYWDDELVEMFAPKRGDNPWATLGLGPDTAGMKQMFTVTKGLRRHTFINTVIKIGYTLDFRHPFEGEIKDLVKRSWLMHADEEDDELFDSISRNINNVTKFQTRSLQVGGIRVVGNSISQFNYESLNPDMDTVDNLVMPLLRISKDNITLIRSETLSEPVKPIKSCDDNKSRNKATGGTVYETKCYGSDAEGKSYRKRDDDDDNDDDNSFTIDTSAVLILNDILGDGTSNLSKFALNQTGFEWVLDNEEKLNSLLLSRGYIMAVDPSLVTVKLSEIRPAMSYLQVVLVAVAIVLGLLGYLAVFFFAGGHYAASLLANLYATSGVNGTDKSRDPCYIYAMPDIRLVDRGDAVRMETATGAFSHNDGDAGGYVLRERVAGGGDIEGGNKTNPFLDSAKA